jgi:hypothetical protein
LYGGARAGCCRKVSPGHRCSVPPSYLKSQCKDESEWVYATVVRLEKHKGEDVVDLNRIESLIENKIQNKFLPSVGGSL